MLYSERKPLEEEFRRIKAVLRGNTSFEKFVTELRIRVRTPNGEEVSVNRDTIVGYNDIANILAAKMRYTAEQLAVVDGKIAKLKGRQDKETTLIDIKTNIEQFDEDISKLNVDALSTKRIISKLEREQKAIEESIVTSVKQNNPLVTELHRLISGYAERLSLDEKYVRASSDYIFTNDLKSLSGAIFHKVVFAFTIAYVKLIEQSAGVVLPIILDSPSGREVSKENVDEMIAILNSDFGNHQIIIASIYDSYDFDNKKIIELRERLLPF
ncbi:hypothetical protein FACS189490_13490 [Clostridia bacterium]|nr:hypothetical protein FACS189490_13490 [Clostridia bacterium]